MCPLLTKETVLGPTSLEERGDRRRPRVTTSLAYHVLGRNRYVVRFDRERQIVALRRMSARGI